MYRLPKYFVRLIGFVLASCLCFGYYFLIPILFPVDNIRRLSFDHYSTSDGNWRNLTEKQIGSMSVLGKWLLQLPGSTEVPKARDASDGREYLILIWQHGPFLERRHIKHFTSKTFSPWDGCSVKNCRLSYKPEDRNAADAVLIHLHKTGSVADLPQDVPFEKRVNQRWVFLTDESPLHIFMSGNQRLSSYNGFFNWSMTYRMDSDVPVAYGRTLPVKNPWEIADFQPDKLLERKRKLVAVMGSNCAKSGNKRWEYVSRLKEILGDKLDIYGHCLGGDTRSCPGHFGKDCESLNSYKFYLAFENSNCREYITEKAFWHGYEKESIPVIMGARREDCRQLLPPKSFIHVDDFANPQTLADYLIYVDKTPAEYMKLHAWRYSFRVINEHGYFQSLSRHYCRLCEALNYNEPFVKIYDDLELFWNAKNDCR